MSQRLIVQWQLPPEAIREGWRGAKGNPMPHTEVIPFGRVVWQSDTAKTYWCEQCQTWLRSQYEGDEIPTIRCDGPMADHVLEWAAPGAAGG